VPPQHHLVAEAIHLIAVVEGSNAGRRVTDLVRVAGLDRDDRYALDRSATTQVTPSGESV
jgi:Flp pilus assembly CpaF family ATPase